MTSQAYLKGVRKHARELYGISTVQLMKHILICKKHILLVYRKTSESQPVSLIIYLSTININ